MAIDITQLITQHKTLIYKIAKSFDYYAYEDLYQMICIKLWKGIDTFEARADITTWIYRIAFNTCISYKKKYSKLNKLSPQEQTIDPFVNQNDQSTQKTELLYRCINKLPPIDRSIIILQLEGHDYEEIELITGINKNNIGVKLNRIRQKLFKLLKDNGFERL